MSDNTRNEPSLEELMSFMGDDPAHVKDADIIGSVDVDTKVDDVDESTTEVDTSTDTDNDNVDNTDTDIDYDTDTKQTTNTVQEPSQGVNPDNGASGQDNELTEQVTALYEKLSEEGILSVSQDFEFDGSVESFDKALDETYGNLQRQARDSFLESIPEEYRAAVKFGMTTGQPIQEFVQNYSTDVSDQLQNLDLSDQENQKQVVARYLKDTTKYSDERINKMISALETSGMLEQEAEANRLELINLEEEKKIQFEQRQQDLERQQEEQERELRHTFSSIIDEMEILEDKRRGKLKAFLNNKQLRRGQQPSTQFQRTIAKVQQNPEHIVQLADILMDYDPEQGFNFKRLEQKVKTKNNSNIKSRLDGVFNPSDQARSGRYTPGSTSSFDWEGWAKSLD